MIPGNAITNVPDPAAFRKPYDSPASALSRTCRGGVALNDASKGRDYQDWSVWYDGSTILFGPTSSGIATGSLATAGVTQLSLAFDNNMNPVLAWLDDTGANIRYFSASTSSYVVVNVPGATSCLACVDDVRPIYNTQSDVIFAYTLPNGLWYTYQRENYATARQASTASKKLKRMGPNVLNRFQFETEP